MQVVNLISKESRFGILHDGIHLAVRANPVSKEMTRHSSVGHTDYMV